MDDRVTDLEKLAATLAPVPQELRQLTGRVGEVEVRLGTVESQIVQLRSEMREEFSAVRGEMAEMRADLRGEIAEMRSGLRGEMTEMRDSLRGEIAQVREDIASLGRETAERFLQFSDEMRTLFEESLGRRRVIAEGNPTPDAPPPARA
jgi:chromosome segregation ATPase